MQTQTTTRATELLTAQAAALNAAIDAELPAVRAAYSTLAQGTLLMRRNGAPSIVDAIRLEARQRALRKAYAAVEGRA